MSSPSTREPSHPGAGRFAAVLGLLAGLISLSCAFSVAYVAVQLRPAVEDWRNWKSEYRAAVAADPRLDADDVLGLARAMRNDHVRSRVDELLRRKREIMRPHDVRVFENGDLRFACALATFRSAERAIVASEGWAVTPFLPGLGVTVAAALVAFLLLRPRRARVPGAAPA